MARIPKSDVTPGKHAGGEVIAPTKITDFAPLYCDPEGNNPVTQFDKSDVNMPVWVKFDFLGLRVHRTIIDWALGMINPRNEKKASCRWISRLIPLDDQKALICCSAPETTAVFQLGIPRYEAI